MHDLQKSVIIIKSWIYRENILQKMAGCNKSRTIESIICHVQGWMFVGYSLYKTYYFLNVQVPVLDTFLYTVLMFFYRTVAYTI